MKTIIISDIHAGELKHGFIDKETGLNSRLIDIQNVLIQILEYAKSNNVENIIIGGDIYDIKSPKNFIRNIFCSIIVKYLKFFNVYIITGNHDQTSTFLGGHALSEIQQMSNLIPNLHVISDPEIIEIGEIEYVFFPHVNKGEYGIKDEQEFIEWNKNKLMELSEKVSKKSILIGHFETDKSLKESDGIALELSFLNKLNFNLIILGHIHKQQALSNKVFHVGSIIKTSFNEEKDDKFFAIINHEAFSLDFETIKDRPFRTFKSDLTKSLTKFKVLEKKIKSAKLDDTITRIVIKIKENDQHLVDLDGISNYLREHSWKYVGILKDIVREDVKETQINDSTTMEDVLKIYIKENNEFFGEDSEECLDEGLKILQEILQ